MTFEEYQRAWAYRDLMAAKIAIKEWFSVQKTARQEIDNNRVIAWEMCQMSAGPKYFIPFELFIEELKNEST